MGAQKPIISGIWGESEEIISESQAGMTLDFSKPKDVSDRLEDFIKRDDLVEMGKQGHTYIMKNGSREKIFEEFL